MYKVSKRIVAITLLTLAIIAFSAAPAFALNDGNGISTDRYADTDEFDNPYWVMWVRDEAGWGENWNYILRLVRGIVTPIAALAVVAGGFMMASSGIFSAASEKQGSSRQEVGKQMILYAVLALIAIYLLPLIIRTAVSVFKGWAWTPPTPTSGGA